MWLLFHCFLTFFFTNSIAMSLTAYQSLSKIYVRLHNFSHLSSIASWDSAANMPTKGAEARANALAEVQMMMHSLKSDPKVKELIEAAETDSSLTSEERANLREIKLDWTFTNCLPESLVEQKSLLGSKCEHEWRTQRANNDWDNFLINLKPVVELSIQEAKILQKELGTETPYDALMAKYEPGQSSQRIRQLFNDLRPTISQYIRQAIAKQATETVLQPVGPFSIEKQKALGLDVMKLIGFDFDAGRLDVSKHPFCGGVPEDVRITTRYNEDDFMESLMGVIHETGHARYEQNLPRQWVNQPAGRARSMGIHESQSLFFEMQLGRSTEFITLIQPLIIQHFGNDPAFEIENLVKLYTRVKADYIRVDADELTYPLHVILRFEIEEALMNEKMSVEDIPRVWNEKMQEYLGVDTVDNYKNGCMQDIHWTDGSFGYFPTYTLGAMYAAQYAHFLKQKLPNFSANVRSGEFEEIFTWLRENIWSKASLLTTEELVVQATGEPLNPAYYLEHLRSRYL
jgi:carboxypeptidase Taq